MKLPELGYRVPVQNTGRMSPTAPMSAANAQADAFKQGARVVMAWKDAEDTSKVSEALTRAEVSAAKLGARLEGVKVWRIEDMGPVPDGIQYKRDEMGPDGVMVLRTEIPMYEIRDQLYDQGMREINDWAADFVGSQAARAMFSKGFRGTMVAGAGTTAATSMKDKRKSMELTMRRSLAASMDNGDVARSVQTIEDGAEAGLFEAEEADTMLTTVYEETAARYGMNRLLMSETVESLDMLELDLAGNDPLFAAMNPAKHSSLMKQVDTKRKALEKELDASLKLQKKELSSNHLFGAIVEAGARGTAYNRTELMALSAAMTPEDKLKFYSYNKALTDSRVTKSDTATHERLKMMVLGLSYQPEGVDYVQQQRMVIDAVVEASGYNLATGQVVGTSLINGTDMAKLLGDIQQAPGLVLKNPMTKEAIAEGFITLTGASEEAYTMGRKAPNLINAMKFKSDLISAARIAGPTFNARAWVENNIDKYLSSAAKRNMDKALELRGTQYFVYPDPTDKRKIDSDASQARIANAVRKGDLTRKEGAELSGILLDNVGLYERRQAQREKK